MPAISKTDMVTKYLNDTSKNGLTLISSDFSSIAIRETRFYSVRPSDDNLFGYFTRYADSYGAGIFTSYRNNTAYQIQNNNGTWTKEELALNSNVEQKVSKTANSINWVTTFSATLEKNGLYLFTSQRYGDIILLTCFNDGNVGVKVVAGNNWTLTGSNQTLNGTATNQADYAIIKLN